MDDRWKNVASMMPSILYVFHHIGRHEGQEHFPATVTKIGASL